MGLVEVEAEVVCFVEGLCRATVGFGESVVVPLGGTRLLVG
jgi:hypothetical protein